MIGRLIKMAAALGLLVAIGCEVTDSLSSEPNFGDPYTVATDTASPSAAPRLNTEGLHVTVQHSGGCRGHRYILHFRVHGDTTELWLQHKARGDTCEALITRPLLLDVSLRVLETEHVVLLAPDDAVFTLR